jgi:putative glutamine amidotransferase
MRPRIAIPARFAASTSALRYEAVVTARRLSELVLLAGGEPLTMHPWAPGGIVDPAEVADRMALADGVLLPGGGDVDPAAYGQEAVSEHVYDVDAEQDAFDLAVARWALERGVPLLAVCRGLQVVNVALGGTLAQHMSEPHRHVVQPLTVTAGSLLAEVLGGAVQASCYHHQQLDRLGSGLRASAHAADGTVEAVELPDSPGWFLGVQWHPEDTYDADPQQLALVTALVTAATSG